MLALQVNQLIVDILVDLGCGELLLLGDRIEPVLVLIVDKLQGGCEGLLRLAGSSQEPGGVVGLLLHALVDGGLQLNQRSLKAL